MFSLSVHTIYWHAVGLAPFPCDAWTEEGVLILLNSTFSYMLLADNILNTRDMMTVNGANI